MQPGYSTHHRETTFRFTLEEPSAMEEIQARRTGVQNYKGARDTSGHARGWEIHGSISPWVLGIVFQSEQEKLNFTDEETKAVKSLAEIMGKKW